MASLIILNIIPHIKHIIKAPITGVGSIHHPDKRLFFILVIVSVSFLVNWQFSFRVSYHSTCINKIKMIKRYTMWVNIHRARTNLFRCFCFVSKCINAWFQIGHKVSFLKYAVS